MHLCTPPSLFPSPCPCFPPLPYGGGWASLDMAVSRRRRPLRQSSHRRDGRIACLIGRRLRQRGVKNSCPRVSTLGHREGEGGMDRGNGGDRKEK